MEMKKLISNFTGQLKHALEITQYTELSPFKKEIRNIVICGMGGSGIGGNIVSEAVASKIKIPIIINKDYSIPNFVGKNSLVIISSYSGDTEETIKAMTEAIDMESKIVCITTGGKIAEIATQKKIDLILIPKGMPPRTAIAYSIVQLLHILIFHTLIHFSFKNNLLAAIELIDAEENNILKDAKETAKLLADKLPVIYDVTGMESVALRFRQQLNENAKMLCWHNVFPELNHNELQGWGEKDNDKAVILFRNDNDTSRIAKRIDISSDIISNYNITFKEVYSKGNTPLERILYLIHWGDWVSYFIAEIKDIDPMDIQTITYLKSELAKVEEY
jgi:glucose/mannose-6-phosphate isomerase